MSMILEGIRVVEWANWQVGPVAAAMLGDLGAEVIKVEERGRGDGQRGLNSVMGVEMGLPHGRNTMFEHHNRNKKSITVDLKKQSGKEIIYRLVEKSDVFITNFRSQATARLGLDYGTLSQYNPRLIYAPISCFGPKGPDSQSPGFDLLAQARSGLMAACTELGMPPIMLSTGIADQLGAIMTAYGVMAALLTRERTGVAQQVNVSLLGSMIPLLGLAVSGTLLLGEEIRTQSRTSAKNPMYNWYKCKDGKWIVLALLQQDEYWPKLCNALGVPELIRDPRFENSNKRGENCEELIRVFDTIFVTKTYEEWARGFRQEDLLFSTINALSDLSSDPQVLENEYIVDFAHPVLGPVKFVGLPVQFSKTPGTLRLCSPELGQHTEEVLLEVGGYTWEEINKLADQGVI